MSQSFSSAPRIGDQFDPEADFGDGRGTPMEPSKRLRRDEGMPDHERITTDPAILSGKPLIRGTRLSVEFMIGLPADGWSEPDILPNYPGIAHEDIITCLSYARDTLSGERV